MLRRIAIAVAAAVLAVVGLGSSQASAAEFFGQQVQPGMVVNSVAVQSGLVRLTDVSVTTATDGNVQASANLYAGASTTPVKVAVQYANANNWSINVQRNGAAPGYAPTSSTSLDINDVEGMITKANGYLTYQLVLRGYVLGDGTFDMTVRVEPEGFVATTLVEDLELGSFTLSHASIEVSSLDAFAEVQASLETSGGNFDVDIKATKPGNATPDQYTLDILFEGAELEGENPAFQFHSFGFHVVLTNPTTGCATIDTSARGSVTIGTSTYTVNDIAIGISCDQLYKFAFSVTLSHYERWSGVTKTANLAIGFMNEPGVYTPKFQDGLIYERGFFGSVGLDAEKSFSEKIDTKRMERTVKIGLGFKVAAYQPRYPGKIKKDPVTGERVMKWVVGDWTAAIGAGGFVDADRISGLIGCGASGGDFTCEVDLRVNPNWGLKDIYHFTWKGL